MTERNERLNAKGIGVFLHYLRFTRGLEQLMELLELGKEIESKRCIDQIRHCLHHLEKAVTGLEAIQRQLEENDHKQ